MRRHAWRLLRAAIRYRLQDLFAIEPLASAPLPRWLRLLARVTTTTPVDEHAAGLRLRDALVSLGPVYIKLGQLLSTRRDLLPTGLADALAGLQDSVPPFPPTQAMDIIRRNLGAAADTAFAHIDETPLASASIAQVHAARLADGTAVVIKVVRPDIRDSIDETVDFLRQVASRLEQRTATARRLRLAEIVADYDSTIHAELDLAREARNTATLRANFAHSPLLYVPRVYDALCGPDILVLERINGIPISRVAADDSLGVDKALLADRGVETFFRQVFVDNFFHADMHPGNVFVDVSDPADPRYIALDCAIIGSLTPTDQDYLARNLVAFFNRDYAGVARLHVQSGWVPATTDEAEFARVIEAVCEPHFARPLGEISFGEFLSALFRTAERFDMQVQPQLVLLQKTLLYVEGLGRALYPQLDLWQTAKPFMERWLLERAGPAAVMGRTLARLPELLESLATLPDWLPGARDRLVRLERQLAEQTARLGALEAQSRRVARRRRLRGVAAVALLGISAALFHPLQAALQADIWQTTAGLAGAAAGLSLLLRALS